MDRLGVAGLFQIVRRRPGRAARVRMIDARQRPASFVDGMQRPDLLGRMHAEVVRAVRHVPNCIYAQHAAVAAAQEATRFAGQRSRHVSAYFLPVRLRES